MSDFRDPILTSLGSSEAVRALLHRMPAQGETRTLGGTVGSSGLAALAAIQSARPASIVVVVCPGPLEADSAEADLGVLMGQEKVHLFPQRESLPFESSEPHLEVGGLRVEAIEALFAGRCKVLVTTLRALHERAPVPTTLADLRVTLQAGSSVGFQGLIAELEDRGFDRVSMVEEVGQFAVRGGILDIFSFGSPEPVRVEFWGDEIESIRAFDILDQRSIRSLEECHILPVDFLKDPDDATVNRSLLELLPRDALLVRMGAQDWPSSLARGWDHAERVWEEFTLHGHEVAEVGEVFLPPDRALDLLRQFPRLDLSPDPSGDFVLETAEPPSINRNMSALRAFLVEGAARGQQTLILCDNDGQVQRLEEILGDLEGLPGTRLGIGAFGGGFILNCASPPLRVLTDHEVFRRPRRLRRSRRFRGAAALESLSQLTPGDYVVHMDHGIGVFKGLQRIDVEGREIEALAIEYAGGEILRVPVYRVDSVERWIGESDEGRPPKVHRIGGRRWKTLKRKTEETVAAMTSQLLEIYARREAALGVAFSPDTRWQKEMESSFLYDDTPDQRKAAEDVKRDMERARPMDRLVCGDVGYGKTEVAVRAAFKAVQDGKQVALLAPTTILVEQHSRTFGERLADYPVRVGALSRFRTAKEQKDLLLELARGGLDVVVGTHRLLSSDVVFKDLGLLIVDEEQRFGVRHKERIKQLRAAVDVLTLSATPIPRTLYLSLSGIRDLSLIQTPPRDRVPIITHVLPWSDQILAEAVHRELDRGGQVFLVHNRVETIDTAARRILRLAPDSRVEVAHGQMPPRRLDEAMRGFVNGSTDILVCSSIIENGLDVANANTLIVDRADRFGLAQLYQIRGRVGRSNRRAYCYLLVPDHVTEEAERRLRVLEHYTELGSGYAVALRDLELRGAGNILGADQSGFVHQVGIDTYLRLVEKAVERVRKGPEEARYPEPDISLSASAFLPDSYISDSGQKLHLYRRLSKLKSPGEVEEVERELQDRFGPVPPEAKALLDGTALRLLGRGLGVERILLKGRSGRITFRSGVVPPLTRLAGPFQDRQVEVEVRRMEPLSLVLSQVGPEPLANTLKSAFAVLGRGNSI